MSSNYRVEPLKDGQRIDRRSPHVVSRSGIIRLTIFILRVIAVLLIVASTFGNYVQFVGGWEYWRPINWPAVAFAVTYQALCSVFQWGFKALRWWVPYVIALIASAIPSFLTYNAWAGPYLSVLIGSILSAAATGIAVVGADALPEWVLIE